MTTLFAFKSMFATMDPMGFVILDGFGCWSCMTRTGMGPKLCIFCYIAMEIYVMGYTSIFSLSFCLYIQPNHSPSTHNQHQHICLCVGGEPQHSSTKNYTLSHSKQSKPKAFPKSKTFIPNLVFQTITLYKGRRCV